MRSFKPGDVVRVPFPYTDRPTRQYRPALVVSHGSIGDKQELLWVVMITSADNRPWPDDVPLGPRHADFGLPAPSLIRPCKIATIETDHAEALGKINSAMLAKVTLALRRYLGI